LRPLNEVDILGSEPADDFVSVTVSPHMRQQSHGNSEAPEPVRDVHRRAAWAPALVPVNPENVGQALADYEHG
jgi:hypothetical protein